MKKFFIGMGNYSVFLLKIIQKLPAGLVYIREIEKHLLFIGFESLLIIGVTGLVMGFIAGLQLGYAMNLVIQGSAGFITGGLAIAIVKELGPMITGLLVVSRVCSSVTAEIATMKISEQVDALQTMFVDPMKFLVVPRVVAGLISLPILSFFSILLAFVGSGFVLTSFYDVTVVSFIRHTQSSLTLIMIVESLTKAIAIGFTLLTISTFFGFYTKGGAVGVGKSTIYSVVASSFSIVVLDFVVGTLFIMLG